MITLKKVDYSNIWDIEKLDVAEGQKEFVAPNRVSIYEAYIALSKGEAALPFGMYHGEELVGFVMFGFGSYEDGAGEEAPKAAEGNYGIWRFMIDEKFQGRGLGREGLEAAIAYVKTFPCGPAESCWLSYEPENTVARSLYASMGFVENGEKCGEEIVAVRQL